MLIEDFYEDFTLLTPVIVSDGEGGSTTTWHEVAKFFAAAVKDTSPEMRAAERAGSKPEYTLTISEHTPVNITYHDVFKRDSDCAVFRAISSSADSKPPKRATFNFAQVRCELWQLP